jgi:hypothetical protein
MSKKYLKTFSLDNMTKIAFFETKNTFTYEELLHLWESYKSNYYYKKKNNLNEDTLLTSLKITLKNFEFGKILDKIFTELLYSKNKDSSEQLIIIYIKDMKKLLYISKSYLMLLKSDDITLPYFELIDSKVYIKVKQDLYKYFNKKFKNDENIIILKLVK